MDIERGCNSGVICCDVGVYDIFYVDGFVFDGSKIRRQVEARALLFFLVFPSSFSIHLFSTVGINIK